MDKTYFVFEGESVFSNPSVISALKAKKLLANGYQGYLAYVIDMQREEVKLDEISIVQYYPKVFLENLSGLPLDREVEFAIKLAPYTTPISTAAYQMAPTELKKLKIQLQKLLDKGFIRPSVSAWGALVLFVKKDETMGLCI